MTTIIDIYWDFENIRPSNTTKLMDVTNIIRSKLNKYGIIRTRNLYIDSQSPTELSTKRGELNLSGWSIIDCPHRGKSEIIDKKIINDLLWSIIHKKESEQLMICIITSDTDFAEQFAKVRDIGIQTCVFYGVQSSDVLKNSCDIAIDWDFEIMRKLNHTRNSQNIQLDEETNNFVNRKTLNNIKEIIVEEENTSNTNTKKNIQKDCDEKLNDFIKLVKNKNAAKIKISDIADELYTHCNNQKSRKIMRLHMRSLIRTAVNKNFLTKNGDYLELKK